MPDDLVFLEHDRIISSVSMYIITVDIQHICPDAVNAARRHR